MMKLSMIGTQIIHTYCYAACLNGCDFPAVERYARPWMVKMMRDQNHSPVVKDARITKIWAGDPTEAERIAEACHIESVVDSPDEACKGVDGVLVLDEDWDARYAHVRRALSAGAHVFCDKLVSAEPSECETAWEEAEKRSVGLFSWSQMAFSSALPEIAALPAPKSVWLASQLAGEAVRTHAIHLYWIARATVPSADVTSTRAKDAGIVCRHADGSTIIVQMGAANSALATLAGATGDQIKIAQPKNSFDLYQTSMKTFIDGVRHGNGGYVGETELRAAAEFMQAARQ